MQTEDTGGALSPSAARVQAELKRLGVSSAVKEMGRVTRSAREAAEAVGCAVAQIAKSLVFRTAETGRPVLVIASGANRVNERTLGGLVGEAVVKAEADFVRQVTGFAIGGVPPLGHAQQLEVFLDADLFRYPIIWAAAGTPQAVFCVAPGELERVTGGRVVALG
jgi:prolyl-tRNA editing enzyme YbaK/EbsC (Cys-tRNA(Pro) deacylase)